MVISSESDRLNIDSSLRIDLALSAVVFRLVSELKSMRGGYGCNLAGSSSGSGKLRTRSTTRCIAVQNSANDNAPSFVTSESSQILESSLSGNLDRSKKGFATEPVISPFKLGCIVLNCFS